MPEADHAPIILLDRDAVAGRQFAGYLAENGLMADVLPGADPLFRRVRQAPPRLILLQSGGASHAPAIDVVRQVRRVSDVPCVVRAREPDSVADRVAALEAGLDDWISVEVTVREVLARIRAVLRRAGHHAAAARYDEVLARKPDLDEPAPPAPPRHWRLSPERRELYAPGGEALGLTSAEFDLLHALVQQRGQPVRRDALSQAVFRRPWYPQDRGVDNVAARLRKKLTGHSRNPDVIKPVRSIGYVFTGF